MTIREKIKQRSAAPIERVEIDGLGEVGVRRLKTGQMLDLSKLPAEQAGVALVASSIVEDDGAPVFANPAAVQDTDWQIVQQLINACNAVNGLQAKVEAAEKN